MKISLNDSLAQLAGIDGFIGAALVDSESGMAVGTVGGNDEFNIEIAAAVNADVFKAKIRAASEIGLADSIQDILVTLDTQYHLLSPLPQIPTLFFYLSLRRDRSNLGMARIKINEAAKNVQF